MQVGACIQRLEQTRATVELPAQVAHRLIQHLASLVDHHHAVAKLFGLRHHMRGEQDGGAATALVGHHAP